MVDEKDLKKVDEAGGGNNSLLGARNDTAPDNRTDGAEAGLNNAIAPTDNKERAIEAGNGRIGGSDALANDASRFTDWISGHGAYGQSGRDFSYGLMQIALVNPLAAGTVLGALGAVSAIHAIATSTFVRYKKTRRQLNKMREKLLSDKGYKPEGGWFSAFKKDKEDGQGPQPFKRQVISEVKSVNKALFTGKNAACTPTGGIGNRAKAKYDSVAQYETKDKLNPVTSVLWTSIQDLYTPKTFMDNLDKTYDVIMKKVTGGKAENIEMLKKMLQEKSTNTSFAPLLRRVHEEVESIKHLGYDLCEDFKVQNAYSFKRGDGAAKRRYNDLKKFWEKTMKDVLTEYKNVVNDILKTADYSKMTSGIDVVATLKDSVSALSTSRTNCEVDDLWAGNFGGDGKGLQLFVVSSTRDLDLGGDKVELEFVNSDLAGIGSPVTIETSYADLMSSKYKLYRSSDEHITGKTHGAAVQTYGAGSFAGDGQFYLIQTRTGEVYDADRGPVAVAGSGYMYVQAWKQTIDASVSGYRSPIGTTMPTSGSIICYHILNYDYVGLRPVIYWDTEERFNSSIVKSGFAPVTLKGLTKEGEEIDHSKSIALNEDEQNNQQQSQEQSQEQNTEGSTENNAESQSASQSSEKSQSFESAVKSAITSSKLKEQYLLKTGYYYIQAKGDKQGDIVFAKTVGKNKIYYTFVAHTDPDKKESYSDVKCDMESWNKLEPNHVLYEYGQSKPEPGPEPNPEPEPQPQPEPVIDDNKHLELPMSTGTMELAKYTTIPEGGSFLDIIHSDEYPLTYRRFFSMYGCPLTNGKEQVLSFVDFHKMVDDFKLGSYALYQNEKGLIAGLCKTESVGCYNLSNYGVLLAYIYFLGEAQTLFDSEDDYKKILGANGDQYISKEGGIEDDIEEVSYEEVVGESAISSHVNHLNEAEEVTSGNIDEERSQSLAVMQEAWKGYSEYTSNEKIEEVTEVPEGVKVVCAVFKKFIDDRFSQAKKAKNSAIVSHLAIGGYSLNKDDFNNIVNTPDTEKTEDIQEDLNPDNLYFNLNPDTQTVEVVNVEGENDEKKITIRYAIEGKVQQKLLPAHVIEENVEHNITPVTKFSENNDLIDDILSNKIGLREGWTYTISSEDLVDLLGGEAAHEAKMYKFYHKLYESYLNEAEESQEAQKTTIFLTCKSIDTTKNAKITFTRHDGQDQDIEIAIMDLVRKYAKNKKAVIKRYTVPFIAKGNEYTFKSKDGISFKDMFGQDGDEKTVLKVESKDNSMSTVTFAWSGDGALDVPFYKIRKEDFMQIGKEEEKKEPEFPTIGHAYLISKEDYVNNISNKNEEVNKQEEKSTVRIVIDAISDDKKIVTLHINKDIQNKIEVPMENIQKIEKYEDVTDKAEVEGASEMIDFFGEKGLCTDGGLTQQINQIKTIASNIDQLKPLFDRDANYRNAVNMYLFGKDIQDTAKAIELVKGVCERVLNTSAELKDGGEYIVCYIENGKAFPVAKKCKVGIVSKDGKEYYNLIIDEKKYVVSKEKINELIFAEMANPLLESELVKLGIHGATFIHKTRYSLHQYYGKPLYEAIVIETNKPDQISKLVKFLATLAQSINPGGNKPEGDNKEQNTENQQNTQQATQQQNVQQQEQQSQTQQQPINKAHEKIE